MSNAKEPFVKKDDQMPKKSVTGQQEYHKSYPLYHFHHKFIGKNERKNSNGIQTLYPFTMATNFTTICQPTTTSSNVIVAPSAAISTTLSSQVVTSISTTPCLYDNALRQYKT